MYIRHDNGKSEMQTGAFRCLDRLSDVILFQVKADWSSHLSRFNERAYQRQPLDNSYFGNLTDSVPYGDVSDFCSYLYKNTTSREGKEFLVKFCNMYNVKLNT